MTVRGTSNSNARGSSAGRRRRREWLVDTFRANVDIRQDVGSDVLLLTSSGAAVLELFSVALGAGVPCCRCYRCGRLLTVDVVTADRIIPGIEGGTYRRNNIRPACGPCNSTTGCEVRRYRPKARPPMERILTDAP